MKGKAILAILVFLAGCLSTANVGAAKESSSIKESVSQGFVLKTLDGNELSSSELMGKKSVISFIATWCYSCFQEATNLRSAVEEIDGPVNVILVDVDKSESDSQLMRFVSEVGLPNWKAARANPDILKIFKVRSLDTTVVLDEEGKVIYRDDGAITSKETFINVLR